MNIYALLGRFLFLVLLLSEVGCAHFRAEPLKASETAAGFEARTLNSADLRNFLENNFKQGMISWPPSQWDFENLALAALYFHPDLYKAYAKWETAKAGIITAGARPNPTIGFSPQFNANLAAGVSPWTYGFTFDLPIETMGKRGRRIAQAKHLSEAAQLDIATVAWQIRNRLRTALVNFYSTNETEKILKKQQAVQEERIQLLEERRGIGGVSILDMTQARISFQQTSLSLRESQKQKAEARVSLADAIGLPVTALDGINLSFDFMDSFPSTSNLNLKDLRQKVLLGRPDILGALAEYAASESALKLEIAKQYPDIHLSPGYQWDQGENKWSLGVNVTLPVLNHNQGPVREAKARREEARAKFIALQSKVIAEIDSSFAGYAFALQKLEEADSLMANQKKKYRALHAMLKTGEASRFALLNAQIELDSANLARFNALTETQQSLGAVEDALQTPLDVPQLNLPRKGGAGK